MTEIDDTDALDASYRAAEAALEDSAARERRRSAVMAAVGSAPPAAAVAAAANEPRWKARRVWWQGTAAVFVFVLSAAAVLRIVQEDPRKATPQEPVSPSTPFHEAPASPAPDPAPRGNVAPESGAAPVPMAAAPAPAATPQMPAAFARAAAKAEASADVSPGVPAPTLGFNRAEPALGSKAAPTDRPKDLQDAGGAPLGAVHASAEPPQPARAPAKAPSDAGVRRSQEFIAAAQAGDIAAVQRYLNHGQPVDAKDRDGRTALTHAVLASDAPMVSLLLARGANPQAADKSGRTPQDYAMALKSAAVLSALDRK